MGRPKENLRIAFLFSGRDLSTEVASVMVSSCQKAMPGIPILQLTDMETPELPGCQAVRRPSENFAVFAIKHFADLEGEVLKLDYDVIVQKDVTDVFDLPFDLAITRRPLNDLTVSNNIRVFNPHNFGVMFLRRSKAFFIRALQEYQRVPTDGWMDVSLAFEEAAATNICRWVELEGEVFNYTPKYRHEDLSHCAIVHYKGDRKHWMVDSVRARADGKAVLDKLTMEAA